MGVRGYVRLSAHPETCVDWGFFLSFFLTKGIEYSVIKGTLSFDFGWLALGMDLARCVMPTVLMQIQRLFLFWYGCGTEDQI